MKKILTTLALTVVFALGACGGGASAGDMEKLKDKACQCTTVECFEGVKKEWDAMDKDLKKKYKKKSDAPESLVKAYRESRKAMFECGSKLRKAK